MKIWKEQNNKNGLTNVVADGAVIPYLLAPGGNSDRFRARRESHSNGCGVLILALCRQLTYADPRAKIKSRYATLRARIRNLIRSSLHDFPFLLYVIIFS